MVRAGLEPATTALKVRLRRHPMLLAARNQTVRTGLSALECTEYLSFGARHVSGISNLDLCTAFARTSEMGSWTRFVNVGQQDRPATDHRANFIASPHFSTRPLARPIVLLSRRTDRSPCSLARTTPCAIPAFISAINCFFGRRSLEGKGRLCERLPLTAGGSRRNPLPVSDPCATAGSDPRPRSPAP